MSRFFGSKIYGARSKHEGMDITQKAGFDLDRLPGLDQPPPLGKVELLLDLPLSCRNKT